MCVQRTHTHTPTKSNQRASRQGPLRSKPITRTHPSSKDQYHTQPTAAAAAAQRFCPKTRSDCASPGWGQADDYHTQKQQIGIPPSLSLPLRHGYRLSVNAHFSFPNCHTQSPPPAPPPLRSPARFSLFTPHTHVATALREPTTPPRPGGKIFLKPRAEMAQKNLLKTPANRGRK